MSPSYSKGETRIVDSAEACRAYEKPTIWNQRGQQGDAGDPGLDGKDGASQGFSDSATTSVGHNGLLRSPPVGLKVESFDVSLDNAHVPAGDTMTIFLIRSGGSDVYASCDIDISWQATPGTP